MTFTGKLYWTENTDCIAHWDSSTGVTKYIVPHGDDPRIPAPPSGTAQYYGDLTLLPDGRVLSFLGQRSNLWAVVFDADLTPESAEWWYAPPVDVAETAQFDSIQIATGDGVIWVPWYLADDPSKLTGTMIAAFDSTGTMVGTKERFDGAWPIMGRDWNGSRSAGNGVLNGTAYYRTTQTQNWITRYNLETGTWTYIRAFLADGTYFSPVGVLNDGQTVYIAELFYLGGDTCRLCTFGEEEWQPIATGDPSGTYYPTPHFLGDTFAIAGYAGSVQIVDDHMLYPAAGGSTGNRWVDRDLPTGTESTVFETEEVYLLQDGTPTTAADPNWWWNFGSDWAAQVGAIAVPSLPDLVPAMDADVAGVLQEFDQG